ncbi:MAG TPA: glycosyltransferase [Pseudonocardia sp.]|jgi:hypothetical protein|nr:glycosyltransferase [Pseudonocardia sp.]
MPRVVPGEVIASAQLDPPGRTLSNGVGTPPAPDRGGDLAAHEWPVPGPDSEAEPGPRVAILTLRDIRPVAEYGGLHDAEDALVDALGASLHRVVLSGPRFGRRPFDNPTLRRALGASRLVRPYRIEHHQRASAPADVLLVLAHGILDASALLGVPGWWELADTVVVHVAKVTERELRRYPELVAHLRRRVDALFSGTEMPPLGHLQSERLAVIGVMPPMLDVLAFPSEADRERTIDVFAPTPPPEAQRLLLANWAQRSGGNFQQDIGQLGAITSHSQHRKVFTSMASRARLFVTNYDQFDHRRFAGAHREAGSRFYDAMAAGCVLVGDLPVGSRQFTEFVAPAGPLPLPVGAVNLSTEVSAALDDPEESRRLGALARATALRVGDAAHRWTQLSTLLGLAESPGIRSRVEHLSALAD